MTKKEIELKVLDYATKAQINSKDASVEVKNRIHTAVKQIIVVAFLMGNKGKDFQFGRNKDVNLILLNMKKDIAVIISKRVNNTKNISKNLNKNFDIAPTDWDSREWLTSTRYDKTYMQRLNTYALRLKYELEAFAAVGMVKGYSQLEIVNNFMLNIESPHTVSEILDASGYAAVRASGILAVGVGGITSAYKSILRLNKDTLMSAYSISNNTTWGAKELRKYILVQNDAKTCAACQMNIGLTFPANEFVIPIHPGDRCVEIPILLSI